jgi:hypothetical protein
MAADVLDIAIVFIIALTFAVLGAMVIGAIWVLIIPKD